ncbi:MAG: histidine phosphatase family protein [Verrucomicrobiota bacterium]
MDLILLRHGKATATSVSGDFGRELTEKGLEQSSRAARLLMAADQLPHIVLTSPLIRARQTADRFCALAGIPGPVIQGWLACGMAPETALSELAAFRDFKRVMIVGHQPDFSQLVCWTLGTGGGAIEIKKASLTGLSISPPSRNATLRFLIPSKLADDPGE